MEVKRYQELMKQCGMPNSRSVYLALEQAVNETEQILQKELEEVKDKLHELMGWCYADACVSLDKKEDYRKTEFPSIWERAKKDLELDELLKGR